MKVTGVTHFLVSSGQAKNFIFVRVDTDEGISGWGEAYTQTDREPAIATYVDRMGQYLVGRDPFNIKHFTHVMYHDVLVKRGSMESYCALSGIEIALWDIVGKKLGAPVYNLLGGACRDKIRVYANGWAGNPQDPDAVAARAVETTKMGFDALKWDPFPDPWRAYISKYEEDLTVEGVAAVRAAVGPDVDLLVEAHRRLAPMHAVRVARRIEEFNPFWYEEPVSARNLPALAAATREINTPVVTGEELYTKTEFREVFELRAADIINPDICNTGGLLELKEIAAMAETYYVVVSPHNFNSTTVGLAATLHLCATIPNFLITEYFVNLADIGTELSTNPIEVDNGYIRLPTGPGLGIELDEDALARHPYNQPALRSIRHPGDEGP